MIWDKEKDKYLTSLINNHGTKWKLIAEKMTEQFNEVFKNEQVRGRWRTELKYKKPEIDPRDKFGVKKVKDKKTGEEEVERLIEVSNIDDKDDDYILEAHGYDPSKWDIINHQFSMWNHYNKELTEPKTLYASKIKVAPKQKGVDWNRFITAIENKEPLEPIEFKGKLPEENTYLEIPLFDLHFGISTLEHYKKTLQKTTALLDESHLEVLFIIGQDLLHNDSFRGQTANGTQIDKVDMEKAWEEAEIFYRTLIDKALDKSLKVTVIYSKGNHDESMAWAFVKNLKSIYRKNTRITFDTKFKERKAHMLGSNFIGTTHGDKNRKNAASNFSVEFPELWAIAKTREIHMGHLHRKRTTKQPVEITIDEKGVIVRELGTGNETDQYHEDNGFNMAHKEFEIFEYTETNKRCIYYV
ncbi:hypothetical protein [Virgibacillus sp. Bac332]|uniref:hypothetical protein n=1 Tax=Virgibacillus sp. Bac332 TaxID=2419842 RepID=UPI000EF50F26|nr:hypothetical protein [Virgibacillus sp. Bac332]